MPDGAAYDDDYYLWTQAQARLLRSANVAGSNLGLDWENVAEEIESLGVSDKRELESRLDSVLEHLLKLAFSPAIQPRDGWFDTVAEQRRRIRSILKLSPSLRREVDGIVRSLSPDVRRDTARKLKRHGEDVAAALLVCGQHPEIEERVLDDDFIPHPPDDATAT